MKWRIGSPSRESRVVPSGRWPWPCCSRIARQRFVRGEQAVDALAALRREERDDVVALGERGDALADALDDARALVAEHRRRVAGRVGARGRVEIGVADAARDEPDEHLAGPRLGEVELLHLERRAELLEHGGADLHARDSNYELVAVSLLMLAGRSLAPRRPSGRRYGGTDRRRGAAPAASGHSRSPANRRAGAKGGRWREDLPRDPVCVVTAARRQRARRRDREGAARARPRGHGARAVRRARPTWSPATGRSPAARTPT